MPLVCFLVIQIIYTLSSIVWLSIFRSFRQDCDCPRGEPVQYDAHLMQCSVVDHLSLSECYKVNNHTNFQIIFPLALQTREGDYQKKKKGKNEKARKMHMDINFFSWFLLCFAFPLFCYLKEH